MSQAPVPPVPPAVQRKLRKARADEAKELSLRGRGLQAVPSALSALTSLRKLDLSANKLTAHALERAAGSGGGGGGGGAVAARGGGWAPNIWARLAELEELTLDDNAFCGAGGPPDALFAPVNLRVATRSSGALGVRATRLLTPSS